jgi:hypothetical protein
VPADWMVAPADEHSWSWTVRGRGEFVSQKRQAPFSPRAGQLVFQFSWSWNGQRNASLLLLVFLGGHNALTGSTTSG